MSSGDIRGHIQGTFGKTGYGKMQEKKVWKMNLKSIAFALGGHHQLPKTYIIKEKRKVET